MAEESTKCDCRICHRHRHIATTIRNGEIVNLQVLVRELESSLMHAEDDAAYYHAIVYGDWPEADEIIAFCREKRKKQAEASDG